MCHTKPLDIFSCGHAKLERFSHDLEKRFRCVIVVCFISQRMKRSKHGFFVFPPKKTLIWRRHFSIGQSCLSMTSKRSIGWFLESSQIRHAWHPIRTCFFVSCLRLDATDGIFTLFFTGQERFGVQSNWPEDQHNWYGVQLDRCWFCQEDKNIPEPLNLILILTMHD